MGCVLFVALRGQGLSWPLLLLLCCLLLCAWFWSFRFQKNIQNEWAEEGEKRQSQSNRKRLWVSVDTASPPEAGERGVNPVRISHRLSFYPTVCLLGWHTGQCSGPSDSHLLEIPSGLSLGMSVSLSLWVRHFHLSCLYSVPFSAGFGEASSRPSRQRPFLNQRLCSPNCQLCLAPAFIQPKNLDVNILQE